jgi:formylglycine-generating enzyme required for sulfatase activity
MEASGYESLVGLFRKLVVPFGDGGLFFSYWAELLSNAEAAKLLCPERRGFALCWWLVNKPLTTGASVNLSKPAVVCLVVVVICGCDQEQRKTLRPTPPGPSKQEMLTPDPTPVPTPVEDMELPESADSIGMKFKLIPAGTFTMGEGDDAHEVTLTQPFKIGVHEVTQAQYEQVMGVNPSHFKDADNPVEKVSWEDAVEFCRKLSELPAEKATGNVYRLPTEAEWEYACRAGTTTKFSFGDDGSEAGDYAWYNDNANRKTHPVGSKQPNAWGLYDMHANASEWCQDWKEDYPAGAVTDPTGPASASYRVLRGGCWIHSAENCGSAYRGEGDPSYGFKDIGFRVVRSSGK